MQSGISGMLLTLPINYQRRLLTTTQASQELKQAFQELVSSPAQRGLLATISKETLVPSSTIASESTDFANDLHLLLPHLKDNEALYIILRRYSNDNDGFIAITYVPDSAPVRQKMLFASTRLTLVRELGIERFRETIFATTKAELSAEGFKKHDEHVKQAAPLTTEEEELGAVKKAEAEEGRGMSVKKAHVGSGMQMQFTDAAIEALKDLATEGGSNLVQLHIDTASETISLSDTSTATPSTLSTSISPTSPRYSFFRYDSAPSSSSSLSSSTPPIIFIYTCPTASKIKERMVYASSRSWVLQVAEQQAGLKVEKKLETSEPSEITAETVREEFEPRVEVKRGFERPRRPGRR
jgi:twinfilin-like protein